MKTGVSVLILLLALSGPALAADPMSASAFGQRSVQGLPLGEGPLAQRGCCSWHKGVCGCQNGRVVCCDGTLSPTCTCRADGGAGAEFPTQAISDRHRAQSAGQRE